eukprot:CAMPEP_0202887146 /NCGR_PEP_ID=MMETSP1391-20130828/42534_1 /ASSEMBLY_ACC=CAM_ASM_000867 /TAXON_ID=1034604 /ORGANISM="Chlamydomonas leiostraca, Strain SAG 11-49" /LENGTH=179 /DNA_ID=CAMNT_0049570423 /DNA_START=481 /DNA_END=1017 /DNA_ORIENTATION=+
MRMTALALGHVLWSRMHTIPAANMSMPQCGTPLLALVRLVLPGWDHVATCTDRANTLHSARMRNALVLPGWDHVATCTDRANTLHSARMRNACTCCRPASLHPRGPWWRGAGLWAPCEDLALCQLVGGAEHNLTLRIPQEAITLEQLLCSSCKADRVVHVEWLRLVGADFTHNHLHLSW